MKPARSTIAIWTIGVVGLLLRWWVVLVYRPTCDIVSTTCYKLAGDAWYTHAQAQLIGEGRFFKIGTDLFVSGRLIDSAGDPPLYPLYLGGWSKLGFDSVTWHRGASTLFGLALIVLIGLLTRRLAGDIAGVSAAILAAVHPLLWVNDVMLLSEGMYQATIVLVLLAAYLWVEHPDRRRVVLLGTAISIAALTRAESVSLFGFLVLPVVAWRSALPRAERVRQVGLAWLAGLMVMAPWLIYNNVRFDKPVTLSTASGTVMLAGSCDTAWSGELMGTWDTCFERRDLFDEYDAALPGVNVPVEGWVKYDESVRDNFMARKAIGYTLDHWKRYPLVAVARIGRSLEFFKPISTLHLNYEVEGRWKLPSTSGLALYYLLVPFTVIGAIAMREKGRRLVPLASMWVMVAFASVITFGLTRYRVPVDVAMVIMSGVGIDWLWRRFLDRRQPAGDRAEE